MSSPSRPSNRNHQPFISLSLWQAVAQAPEMSPRKGMLNSCLLSVASGHTRKPFLLALNESLASFHRRGSPSLAIWGAPAGNSCVMTATAPAEAGLFLGPLGCLSAARAAAAAILALFFFQDCHVRSFHLLDLLLCRRLADSLLLRLAWLRREFTQTSQCAHIACRCCGLR